MINKPTSIDTYIAGFPPDIQEILQRVREVVKTAVGSLNHYVPVK